MKLLDRYIFRETLVPTLIALLALTFVMVAQQMGGLVELVVRRSATAAELWAIIAAIVPSALMVTIPTALLVGVLTGFGRMSSDSESVAFRAGGVPTRAILRPVLALGFLAWAVNLALSIWVAPASAARLEELKFSIGVKQLSFELQPRVFNENLGNGDLVLYVRDVSAEGNEWRGILLADLGTPDTPSVTMAQYGRFSDEASDGTYEVTLFNGSTHIVMPLSPDRYTFSQWNVNTLPVPVQADPAPTVELSPTQVSTEGLWRSMGDGSATFAEEVEFHRRIALPFACLVFALIGLPLGLSTRRGGRSMGLVVSVLLMLVYYMVFIGGTRIAGNAQLSPFLGTWGANIAFAALGIFLLIRSEKEQDNRFIGLLIAVGDGFQKKLTSIPKFGVWIGRWAYSLTHHPTWFRTLDVYVLRGFSFFFLLVLVVFVALFMIVTLFELLPDIVKNNSSSSVVAGYFFYLLPQILHWVMPLAVLLAVLVNLGTLTKRNETLAAKAGAISLYRMSVPLLVVALLLSVGVYFMQDYLLPYSNQRQDEYRNRIKGRAAQTYRDPLRKWMAGSENQIYHYNYFDPARNAFAGISVFEFDPESFGLRRWTFALRGSWDGHSWILENGWSRSLQTDGGIAYEAFERRDFGQMEDGPDYFKKEVRTASQMSYPELRLYIDDLSQSGFDTSSLSVDLYRKLSFPFVSLIMAIIAVPFSFTTGRKGAFYGIGISIVIGISYWAAFEFFDTLGGINRLSPLIAAWFPNLIFGFSGIWMLLKVRT